MTYLTIKDLIAWCDCKVAEGHVLTVEWDGGADEGWLILNVDGAQTQDPETEKLVEMMNTIISKEVNYSWWIGDQWSSGSAHYDPIKKTFFGKHGQTYDGEGEISCNIEIRIPIRTNFETLSLQFFDFEDQTYVDFVGEDCEALEEVLAKELASRMKERALVEIAEDALAGCFLELDIPRAEFIEEGEDLVYTITSFVTFEKMTDTYEVVLSLESLIE